MTIDIVSKSHEPFTVLEIGSGSFKLHRENSFSNRFNSSLGKNLLILDSKSRNGDRAAKLDPASVEIALKSLTNELVPFLAQENIDTSEVLVFATSAIRQAMNDPEKSGEQFLEKLQVLGFRNIRIFSEDEESVYGAMGALAGFRINNPEINVDNIAILDTGGASHQLTEIKDGKIAKKTSVPIGSHTDLDKNPLPDFLSMGYSKQEKLVVIGTSGRILGSVPDLDLAKLKAIRDTIAKQTIEERREYLKTQVMNTQIHKLFVDYRLEIMPNSFTIIINCAENLGVKSFLASSMEAKNYVSLNGFID